MAMNLKAVGAAVRNIFSPAQHQATQSPPTLAPTPTPASTPAPAAAAAGTPINRYDAAGQGRRMRGWNAPGTGPNRSMAGQETLRNRARDAGRNDWTAAAAQRVWATNLIGCGIVPRPRTTDADLKRRLVEAWESWLPHADADGVLDFYGLQTLAVRAWITDGEVFIRFRHRRPDDGLPVPLQLQLLEGDMVPRFDADSWPGMPAGHHIRSGVEFSRFGRREAY